MARAAYIVRKDGRYWFQKRFGVMGDAAAGPTHLRLSLRTANYRVAVGRMLRVMRMVYEFENAAVYEAVPDISRRANLLVADMLRIGASPNNYDEGALVERHAVELLVSRFISEARLRGHQLVVDPPEFWPTWMTFCNGNAIVEAARSRSSRAAVAKAAPDIILTSPSMQASGTSVDRLSADRPLSDANNKDSLLSVIVEAFLDQRLHRDGDGRAREDTGLILQFVADLLGDVPMSKLSSTDLLRVENALPEIPHPSGIPRQYNKSLHTRWLYAVDHGWDGLKRISKTRIRDVWHQGLHSFFGWAKTKGFYEGPDYRFSLISRQNPSPKDRDAWRPAEII